MDNIVVMDFAKRSLGPDSGEIICRYQSPVSNFAVRQVDIRKFTPITRQGRNRNSVTE
jgi:hypothetical protein